MTDCIDGIVCRCVKIGLKHVYAYVIHSICTCFLSNVTFSIFCTSKLLKSSMSLFGGLYVTTIITLLLRHVAYDAMVI